MLIKVQNKDALSAKAHYSNKSRRKKMIIKKIDRLTTFQGSAERAASGLIRASKLSFKSETGMNDVHVCRLI